MIALKINLRSIPKLLREKADNASRKTILAEAKFRETYLAKPRDSPAGRATAVLLLYLEYCCATS